MTTIVLKVTPLEAGRLEFAAKILEETVAWRLVEAPLDAATIPLGAAVKGAAPRLAN